jgi:hypothetical protein
MEGGGWRVGKIDLESLPPGAAYVSGNPAAAVSRASGAPGGWLASVIPLPYSSHAARTPHIRFPLVASGASRISTRILAAESVAENNNRLISGLFGNLPRAQDGPPPAE